MDASAAQRPPIRLLIVDDNDDLRHLFSAMLAGDARFELVGLAADGFEALRLVKDLSPEVVLLDQMMPQVSGTTVLSRTVDIAPGTKVVLYTNDPSVEDEAIERGAVAVVSKIESFEAVLDLVVRAVAGGGPS